MLMETVQGLATGDTLHAQAYVIQCAKALHQVALDQGSWANAQLLIPTPDPLGRAQFGGEETELAAVQRHRKSLRELNQKHNQTNAGNTDEQGDGSGKDPETQKNTKKNSNNWAKGGGKTDGG